MKKQIIPTTNPLGNGVTQWDDPSMMGPQLPDWLRGDQETDTGGDDQETDTGGDDQETDTGGDDQETDTSSGFSWNNLVSHLGSIFNGIGNIIGNANSYSRSTDTTNRTVNETHGSLSFTNGTTLTVIILGGIALIITLILVLGKK